MSGILQGVGINQVTENFIEVYNIPNLNIPVTWFFRASLHDAPGGPALQTASIPGTGGPFTAYGGFGLLDPSRTYWVRYYIEDAGGDVVAEGGRWITTLPAGSYTAQNVDNPAYNSCGDDYTLEARHSWGYQPNQQVVYGQRFRSPAVKGGEIA